MYIYICIRMVGGWALPLWKMMEFVSWDDDIPNWMESHKSHVPNHQPDINVYHYLYASGLNIGKSLVLVLGAGLLKSEVNSLSLTVSASWMC